MAFLLMLRGFRRRLGGITGDCIGAMIEVIETVALCRAASGATVGNSMNERLLSGRLPGVPGGSDAPSCTEAAERSDDA
jgi:hypothetical protein